MATTHQITDNRNHFQKRAPGHHSEDGLSLSECAHHLIGTLVSGTIFVSYLLERFLATVAAFRMTVGDEHSINGRCVYLC